MGQARDKMLRQQAEMAKLSPVLRLLAAARHYRPDGSMIDHAGVEAAWAAHKRAA